MSLEQKIERWLRIREGQEAFGDGPAAQQGQRYYLDHLLGEVIELARRRGVAGLAGARGCELLVSVSGLSPATTALACRVLEPRRLAVVHTDADEHGVQTIRRFAVGTEAGCVDADAFTSVMCEATDPRRLARLVGELVDGVEGACVDITGGKKLMSAAAAVAAVSRRCRICYVQSTFDPAIRLPRPGSEQVTVLDWRELTGGGS